MGTGTVSPTASRRAFLIAVAGCALTLGCRGERRAFAAERPPEPATPTLALPPRPAGAETGSAFLARTAEIGPADFERAVLEAITSGNVPPFERELVAIELTARGTSGAEHRARVHVLCDYLAIGSDDDFARVPMLAATAQRIASTCHASLPTRRLVDAIYEKAVVKLPARAMQIDVEAKNLRSLIGAHQRVVERLRASSGARLGALTAGDKKDIVLTNQLAEHPGRVAIYGFQREDGSPIQPLSTVHDRLYADYSHGVRLVADDVEVDGHAAKLEDVLRDPELAALVSDEGPLRVTAYPT